MWSVCVKALAVTLPMCVCLAVTLPVCVCGLSVCQGTGCNAAYLEKVDNVHKWTGAKPESSTVGFAVLLCVSTKT